MKWKSQVEEGAEQHVPGRPGEAVEVDGPHGRAARRVMRGAWQGAPTPLSMFTTESPAAQEVSMAKRAVSPPRLAPYPTEVGTAMTGTSTSPATTEGRAPSMPATT